MCWYALNTALRPNSSVARATSNFFDSQIWVTFQNLPIYVVDNQKKKRRITTIEGFLRLRTDWY